MKKILEVLIYLFFFIYSYSLTAKARSYNCEDFTKFALNKIEYQKILSSDINIFKEKDEIKKNALEICKKELDEDNINAIKNFNYAYVLFANKKFEEAKSYLDFSSQQGYQGAQLYILLAQENGWLKYDDDFVKKNLDKAAEQGNYMAIYRQGQKHYGDYDLEEAKEKFKKIKFYNPADLYLTILEIQENAQDYEKIKYLISKIKKDLEKDYFPKKDSIKSDILTATAVELMNAGISHLALDILQESIKIEKLVNEDEFIITEDKKKNKVNRDLVFTFQQLGFVYNSLGDFLKSEQNYLKALSLYYENRIYIDNNDPSFYPNLLNLIGILYWDLDEKNKAIKFIKDSVDEFAARKINNVNSVISIGNLGLFSSDKNEAKKYLELHYNLVQKNKLNPLNHYQAIGQLIQTYLKEENLVGADEVYNSIKNNLAKSIYNQLLFNFTEAQINFYKKNIQLSKQQLLSTNIILEQNYNKLDFLDYYYLKRTFLNLLQDHLDISEDTKVIYNRDLSLLTKRIIKFVESINEFNDQYISLIKSFTPILVEYLEIKNFNKEIHFQVSQLLSMHEIDFAATNLKNRDFFNSDLVKEIQEISYDIKYLKQNPNEKFIDKISALEEKKKLLISKLNIKNYTENLNIYSLNQTQKNIKDDECLIFFINKNNKEIFRIFIDSKKYSVKKIIFKDDLNSHIKNIKNSIDDYSSLKSAYNFKEAEYLYTRLFKDLNLEKEKIILLKTNTSLNFIPLNILGYFSEPNKFIFNYENFSIYNLASLNYFFDNKKFSNSKKFLGVGNPEFKDNKDRIKDDYSRFLYRGLKEDLVLKNIPNTENEIISISKNFSKINIKNFLKTEANEKTIKQTNLFDYEYIVFATHGVSLEDSGNREFTGLALTTPNEISDIDNGFLTYREILKLRLNSKLVLLSACNTALDNDADSNAFSGLVNSFIFSGSSAVLSSHWYVETLSTEKITTKFFENFIKNNSNAAKSLKNSINDLRKNYPKYDHPIFWGAFSITINQRI